MPAPALHAVIMRRFTIVKGQLFPGFDIALRIDLHPLPIDAHENIGATAVVQMAESVPPGAVKRMSVIQVDEAHAALSLGTLSRRADGYDLAGDLADLCTARDPGGCENARSLDGASSGFDVEVQHVVRSSS
jgi:hypothetical protein